jgi:Putative beta barrel porin-7 (BBP7)
MRAGVTCLLVAALCLASTAQESATLADDALSSLFEPANWQQPIGDPLVEPPIPPDVVIAVPPQDTTALPMQPLLDSTVTEEELMPGIDVDAVSSQRRGVEPYGGGHPGDWPWGCGGSPFRTGPGHCDDWDVGCRWDVAVDGMVMSREDADLAALAATPFMAGDPAPPLPYLTDQFDYEPGGRVSFISKFPHYSWQMHAGYEGIEEWNASVVFPKEEIILPALVFPPTAPVPPPFPEGTEQRSIHYRSSLHSGELNFVRDFCSRVWRPYCGVRYVKFDDEINDFINQDAQPPLPGPRADVNPIGPVVTTDRLNLFDVENNLIGFQVGLRHDLWRPMRRLSVEGFVNAGVYYNRIKYTNLMLISTRQDYADNTTTTEIDEARRDFSTTVNNDVSELSEISYIAEASLSGVCRLNKCWALRAGYQALWITDVHVAEDAFLNGSIDVGMESQDMFFHGWHAGVEHRR